MSNTSDIIVHAVQHAVQHAHDIATLHMKDMIVLQAHEQCGYLQEIALLKRQLEAKDI